MRMPLIEQMKLEIEYKLRKFLRDEGIELHIASNDNIPALPGPVVELEALADIALEGTKLLTEIKVLLGILGKPWQCDALIEGLYQALHPHYVTHEELTVLLMSLHIESVHCVRPRRIKKRAVLRYIVEEDPCSTDENGENMFPSDAATEYC